MLAPFLKTGDTVAIVATARAIDLADLSFAIGLLEDQGYRVKLGSSIGVHHHQFAGTDAIRIRDMQNMLDDPEVKAIWIARGGYGTARILDHLDFSKFSLYPKWIIGFSDITALLSHTFKHTAVKSVHAVMPSTLDDNSDRAITSLFDVLKGNRIQYQIPGHPLNRLGKTDGELIGGNLSVLYSIMGSSSDMDWSGKILFLEDLDEYLYHIDRMLINLHRNDKFRNLAGLVIGGFSDMNDNDIPFGISVMGSLIEKVEKFKYPVCFGFPVGHIPDNMALIYGQKATLEINEEGVELSF